MSDGFLGRWSKRKLEARQGKLAEPAPKVQAPSEPPPVRPPGAIAAQTPLPEMPAVGEVRQAEPQVELPPPTLDDVESLTPESDFKRFAAADVAPEVKNAAMKKLFADPRFNVMDGMDVYIDDYSKPDPIPEAMLRQLASSKFLGLFRDEEKQEAETARQSRDDADNPTAQKVAQSGSVPEAVPDAAHDADPDLQLQQDHAAPGEDPGRGTG